MLLPETVFTAIRRYLLDERRILRKVGSPGRILDMGCGYGQLAYSLARAFPKAEVVGVDADRGRISEAKIRFRAKNLSFTAGDAAGFKSGEKFDAIVMADLFHHVPKRLHPSVTAMARYNLRKNGLLVIADINPSSPLRFFNTLHDRLLNGLRNPSYVSDFGWKKLLSGFDIDTIEHGTRFVYPRTYVTAKRV